MNKSRHDYNPTRPSGLLPAVDGWRMIWIEREHVHSLPVIGWWVDPNHWTQPILAGGEICIDDLTDHHHCLIVDLHGRCWRWTVNWCDGACEWETLDAALMVVRAEPEPATFVDRRSRTMT